MWSQQKNNGWKSSTSPNSSNKNGSPVNGQAEPKIFGITSAISTAEPKPSDLTRTDDLEKVLRSYNVFEDESEIQHRMNILGKLNTLVREWTKAISLKKNLPPNIAEKVRSHFAFSLFRCFLLCNFYCFHFWVFKRLFLIFWSQFWLGFDYLRCNFLFVNIPVVEFINWHVPAGCLCLLWIPTHIFICNVATFFKTKIFWIQTLTITR